MSIKSWVNGKPSTTIAIGDRGLNYGDGLFTTILVSDGDCALLARHVTRLHDGCGRLRIIGVDFDALKRQLVTIAAELGAGYIKVVITRGLGQRGYSSLNCDLPHIIISAGALPEHYPRLQAEGISLAVSTVLLGLNPATAGLKHLNRLEQVLVRQEIDDNGWEDAIVLDWHDNVVETNIANLFWVIDATLYTPSLELAGVNGLMRGRVIELAKEMGVPVKCGRYLLADLTQASELFMTNCLMQLVPIVAIEQQRYAIGDLTKQFAQRLKVKGLDV